MGGGVGVCRRGRGDGSRGCVWSGGGRCGVGRASSVRAAGVGRACWAIKGRETSSSEADSALMGAGAGCC